MEYECECRKGRDGREKLISSCVAEKKSSKETAQTVTPTMLLSGVCIIPSLFLSLTLYGFAQLNMAKDPRN